MSNRESKAPRARPPVGRAVGDKILGYVGETRRKRSWR